ncbi:MAG: hypothetical protein HUK20_03165 [Fibrobacter sp.]|nr:hypothetical protein [Fibrobacter sp.]
MQRQLLQKFFSDEVQKENTEKYGENDLVDEIIQNAFEHTGSSSWGTLSGNEYLRLQLANTRKVDVRQILRRFNTSVSCNLTEDTRMKLNRRYGLKYPGRHHLRKSKILIAIDASGSVRTEDLTTAIELINSFVRSTETFYCYWDTACSDFFKTPKKLRDISLDHIGGGTTPDCILKKIEEEKECFDGIVVITDGCFVWDKPKTTSKIFMLLNSDQNIAPGWCRYSTTFTELLKLK